MVELDDYARMTLEKNIDYIVKEPKKTTQIFMGILMTMGIEPGLETVLSFLAGNLAGLTDGIYLKKYERVLNVDERLELTKLLRRRAFEMRFAFLSAMESRGV